MIEWLIDLIRVSSIVRALQNRNYRIYISGNAISLVGSWMQRLAIGWLTWQLTESGAWLGLMAFADLFPSIILGPIGGAIADRQPRLRILQIATVLRLLQATTLTALTAAGLITVEWLLLLTLATGFVAAFNQPARLALIPSLVRPEDIPSAIAVNSVVFNLARFVGPAIGGFVIVSAGIAPTFAINTVTYVIFLLFLFRIKITEDHGKNRSGDSILRSIAEGLVFAARHPGIAPLLLLMVTSFVLARPFVELLPGFADDVFGGGAALLAVFTATVGLGAVAGGILMAELPSRLGLVNTILVSTAVSAIALLVFAAVDSVEVAIPALALVGFTMVAYGVGSLTLLQANVPSEMRGRLLSLYGLIFRGGPSIGAIGLGGASEYLGLQLPVGIAATVVLIGVIITFFRRREILYGMEK